MKSVFIFCKNLLMFVSLALIVSACTSYEQQELTQLIQENRPVTLWVKPGRQLNLLDSKNQIVSFKS